MTFKPKRGLLLGVAFGVAVGAGALAWAIHRGADPVYDDDTALAGWAERLAHPPSSIALPEEAALPETSTGQPLRRGAPLPIDRSLNVVDRESPSDAAGEDRFSAVASTSELVLTASKRRLRFEGRDVLPIPADPTHGFDVKYKHDEADLHLLEGAVAPVAYARQRAWDLRKKLGQFEGRENLLVMADRELPCRVLAEVFYTVGALSFAAHLVGVRAGKVVDVSVSEQERLDRLVRVTILPQRFELEVPRDGGVIACERGQVEERDGGDRLATIPRHDEDYDFAALTVCARQIEKAFDHELVYAVAPDAVVSVQSLVSAIDALRQDAARQVSVGLDFSGFRRAYP